MNIAHFYLKTKILNSHNIISAIAGFCYSFFMPIGPVIIAVIVLTVLDMITGVAAAATRIKKFEENNPGKKSTEKINSRGLFRTAQKFAVYVCGIVGGHVIETVYLADVLPAAIPLVYIISFPMAWTELKSLDENTYEVTGVSFWAGIQNIGNRFLKK